MVGHTEDEDGVPDYEIVHDHRVECKEGELPTRLQEIEYLEVDDDRLYCT